MTKSTDTLTGPRHNVHPSGPLIALGEVCALRTETFRPQDDPGRSFRYVDISSVDNRLKRINGARALLASEAPSRARMIIRRGDVIVSTTRPNLNAVARVPDELDGEVCSTGFCVLRPLPRLDADYLFAYTRSPGFVRSLSDIVKGALYPAVTDKQVRSQLIPLPSLAEQRHIATRLNEQLAVVEGARASSSQRLLASQRLPGTILQSVFHKSAGSRWPTIPLNKVAELLASKSVASDGDTEVQAATTACLSEEGFRPGGIKLARMSAVDAQAARLRSGEVLVARSNTPELVGRAAEYVGEPACVVASDLTIRVLAGEQMESTFLAAYLTCLYLSGYWRERAGGASGTMKKITRTQLLALPVPVPTLEEQRRVAAKLRSALAGAVALREKVAEEHRYLGEMDSALLRAAFGGGA